MDQATQSDFNPSTKRRNPYTTTETSTSYPRHSTPPVKEPVTLFEANDPTTSFSRQLGYSSSEEEDPKYSSPPYQGKGKGKAPPRRMIKSRILREAQWQRQVAEAHAIGDRDRMMSVDIASREEVERATKRRRVEKIGSTKSAIQIRDDGPVPAKDGHGVKTKSNHETKGRTEKQIAQFEELERRPQGSGKGGLKLSGAKTQIDQIKSPLKQSSIRPERAEVQIKPLNRAHQVHDDQGAETSHVDFRTTDKTPIARKLPKALDEYVGESMIDVRAMKVDLARLTLLMAEFERMAGCHNMGDSQDSDRMKARDRSRARIAMQKGRVFSRVQLSDEFDMPIPSIETTDPEGADISRLDSMIQRFWGQSPENLVEAEPIGSPSPMEEEQENSEDSDREIIEDRSPQTHGKVKSNRKNTQGDGERNDDGKQRDADRKDNKSTCISHSRKERQDRKQGKGKRRTKGNNRGNGNEESNGTELAPTSHLSERQKFINTVNQKLEQDKAVMNDAAGTYDFAMSYPQVAPIPDDKSHPALATKSDFFDGNNGHCFSEDEDPSDPEPDSDPEVHYENCVRMSKKRKALNDLEAHEWDLSYELGIPFDGAESENRPTLYSLTPRGCKIAGGPWVYQWFRNWYITSAHEVLEWLWKDNLLLRPEHPVRATVDGLLVKIIDKAKDWLGYGKMQEKLKTWISHGAAFDNVWIEASSDFGLQGRDVLPLRDFEKPPSRRFQALVRRALQKVDDFYNCFEYKDEAGKYLEFGWPELRFAGRLIISIEDIIDQLDVLKKEEASRHDQMIKASQHDLVSEISEVGSITQNEFRKRFRVGPENWISPVMPEPHSPKAEPQESHSLRCPDTTMQSGWVSRFLMRCFGTVYVAFKINGRQWPVTPMMLASTLESSTKVKSKMLTGDQEKLSAIVEWLRSWNETFDRRCSSTESSDDDFFTETKEPYELAVQWVAEAKRRAMDFSNDKRAETLESTWEAAVEGTRQMLGAVENHYKDSVGQFEPELTEEEWLSLFSKARGMKTSHERPRTPTGAAVELREIMSSPLSSTVPAGTHAMGSLMKKGSLEYKTPIGQDLSTFLDSEIPAGARGESILRSYEDQEKDRATDVKDAGRSIFPRAQWRDNGDEEKERVRAAQGTPEPPTVEKGSSFTTIETTPPPVVIARKERRRMQNPRLSDLVEAHHAQGTPTRLAFPKEAEADAIHEAGDEDDSDEPIAIRKRRWALSKVQASAAASKRDAAQLESDEATEEVRSREPAGKRRKSSTSLSNRHAKDLKNTATVKRAAPLRLTSWKASRSEGSASPQRGSTISVSELGLGGVQTAEDSTTIDSPRRRIRAKRVISETDDDEIDHPAPKAKRAKSTAESQSIASIAEGRRNRSRSRSTMGPATAPASRGRRSATTSAKSRKKRVVSPRKRSLADIPEGAGSPHQMDIT